MTKEPEPFRNVGAIVLAAGEASRFGAPKQRVLLPLVLDVLRRTPLSEIVVVQGAYPLSVEGVRVATAHDWNRGPGASLSAGLAKLGSKTEAAVAVLADGPHLNPRAVERLVLAWRAGAGTVLAATYASVRGHPLVIDRCCWSSVPVEGLRSIHTTFVACDDLGHPGDIDIPEDMENLDLDSGRPETGPRD